MTTPRRFSVVPGRFAVARLAADAPLPPWAAAAPGPFLSITRTPEELSIVCPEGALPDGVRAERGWALLRLLGPFPFTEVGVLASFAAPLAAAGIGIFTVSTFDTDYLLVAAPQLGAACDVLLAEGHLLAG
ncbi:MAG: ACT domain-containing protein [Thermoanaerobaculia bacterium]|nr:ACT domain-containing protein [Thermoanaerobaculia bacterium]MCZ7652651.1 ACT domain-containing protein [Thermoanaerobaculia bacterium]